MADAHAIYTHNMSKIAADFEKAGVKDMRVDANQIYSACIIAEGLIKLGESIERAAKDLKSE